MLFQACGMIFQHPLALHVIHVFRLSGDERQAAMKLEALKCCTANLERLRLIQHDTSKDYFALNFEPFSAWAKMGADLLKRCINKCSFPQFDIQIVPNSESILRMANLEEVQVQEIMDRKKTGSLT